MIRIVGRCLLGMVFGVALVMAAGPVHGQTMMMRVDEIPVPTDETPQALNGLEYGYPWIVEFTSIRAERDPDKGVVLWTITGSSGRARPERVQLVVKLMDANGKDIASGKKATIVKTGGDEYEYVVKMKLKPGIWEAAAAVKVFVNFYIAS